MTCSVATVLSPDVVTCTATNGTFNSSQVTAANLVTATATISGAAASNYTLGLGLTTVSVTSISVSTASSITTRPVTATLTAQNKPYDGTNTEPNGNMSCSLNNIVAGDANVTCTASNPLVCAGIHTDQNCAPTWPARNRGISVISAGVPAATGNLDVSALRSNAASLPLKRSRISQG